MASSEKTSNLQLNNWIGSDRSQREDFNADNEKIDAWAGEVNSQLNAKVNKESIVNELNVSEEGFVADARTISTLNNKMDKIIIKKIYPTFTNGVGEYTLNGANSSTPVIVQSNHLNSYYVTRTIVTDNLVKIILSDENANGAMSLTLMAKL